MSAAFFSVRCTSGPTRSLWRLDPGGETYALLMLAWVYGYVYLFVLSYFSLSFLSSHLPRRSRRAFCNVASDVSVDCGILPCGVVHHLAPKRLRAARGILAVFRICQCRETPARRNQELSTIALDRPYVDFACTLWLLHTKTCGPDPRVGPGVDATALRRIPWVADMASFMVCPLLPVVPVTPPLGTSATRSVTLTSAKKCAPMSCCHAAHPGVRGVTEFFATTCYFTTQSSNRPRSLSYELPDGTSSLLAPNVSTRKLCSSQDHSGIHDNSSFMKRDVDSCNMAITRPMHPIFSELVDDALYGRRRLLSLLGDQCWCEMPLLLKLVKVLSPLCVIAGSWHFGLHDKPEHSASTRDGSFSCCRGHALTLQPLTGSFGDLVSLEPRPSYGLLH